MNCYLCDSENIMFVDGRVRDKHHLKPLRCENCGLVFLNKTDHIDHDYYKETYTEEQFSNMSLEMYLNEYYQDNKRQADKILPLITNCSYLDVGCGAGGVLRLVREHCSAACGVELQTKWREELIQQGFIVFDQLSKVKDQSVDVASVFHVLGHVHCPVEFLREIKSKIKPNGKLIIEIPNANDALLLLYDCKAFSSFIYLSPHLFIFNPSTLELLFKKAGFKQWTIQQVQRYPLSNHLMWLVKGKPGGHQQWSFIDTSRLQEAYESSLAALGCCDTLFATIFL
ncbi:MAG: class I SAM-dependent methyltransferase [Pseudomonadota bacterium]